MFITYGICLDPKKKPYKSLAPTLPRLAPPLPRTRRNPGGATGGGEGVDEAISQSRGVGPTDAYFPKEKCVFGPKSAKIFSPENYHLFWGGRGQKKGLAEKAIFRPIFARIKEVGSTFFLVGQEGRKFSGLRPKNTHKNRPRRGPARMTRPTDREGVRPG